MVELSDSQYQALILAELQDPDGVLAAQLPTLWAMYADIGLQPATNLRTVSLTDPAYSTTTLGTQERWRLRYLYVKYAAIQLLRGQCWPDVNFDSHGDIRVNQSERFAHLTQMMADTVTEISRALKSARVPVVGALLTTAPVPSALGLLDANSTAYMGDPNIRVWPWRTGP